MSFCAKPQNSHIKGVDTAPHAQGDKNYRLIVRTLLSGILISPNAFFVREAQAEERRATFSLGVGEVNTG